MAASGYNTDYHRYRRHRGNTADTKGEKLSKYILSFVLCLLLTAFIVLIGLKAVALNPKYIAKAFTSYEYTVQLQDYIKNYAYDKCLESGIDTAAADAVTYQAADDINKAAVYKQFELDEGDSYKDSDYYIGGMCADFSDRALKLLMQNGIDADARAKAEIDEISDDINKFAVKCTNFEKLQEISSAVKLAGVVLTVLLISFAILLFVLSLIIYFIGSKRYRALRFISYSFGASGLISAVFCVFISVFNSSHQPNFYPVYLITALNGYIDYCLNCFAVISVAMFIAYIVLIAAVWKMKRKGK